LAAYKSNEKPTKLLMYGVKMGKRGSHPLDALILSNDPGNIK